MASSLVCLYGTPVHAELAARLMSGRLGARLRRLGTVVCVGNWRVAELPTIAEDAPEGYSQLPDKTVAMIRSAVERYRFDQLLKVDVTIEGHEDFRRFVSDLEQVFRYLDTPLDGDYDGVLYHQSAARSGAEAWAKRKAINLDWQALYGDDDALIPFYSGKLYRISRRFAEYIAQHGDREMQLSAAYHPAEDYMMARLHQGFLSG